MEDKSNVDRAIDKIVSPIERIDKHNKIDNTLKYLLSPFNQGWNIVHKIAKKTHESVPFVYEQLESFIKSHVITLKGDKKALLDKPDLEVISNLISGSIVKKLPNVDLDWDKIEKDKSSFLQIVEGVLSGDTHEASKEFTTLADKVMFKKILVANRGEIAIRVMRACREFGICVVVVYSEPDKESLAVKLADEAFSLGEGSTGESYMDINKIVDIAKKAKVDAVHPGYGFLAENPEFAVLCEVNSIKFIGPSSKTINEMGNKIEAREKVNAVGVPILPGSQSINNKEEAVLIGSKIGYPFVIKAAAGSGGRGLKIINTVEEVEEAFVEAKEEAKRLFNDDTLYIEKYVDSPKHIEFQILADKYGNVIHLGERDCSIQRKHQKLIEEAPSPALSAKLRKKMGEAAVLAASATSFEGAGTVEFLLDEDEYYFVEMNTRIQVEHGITESVTGIDIVKEQLKIAAGALISVEQKDIKLDGYAIECRINAEDPLLDFQPSPGTITNYLPPGGPGVRVCSCSHVGLKITPYYDSMISKLIVKGKDREEAIAKMRNSLKEYVIEGVKTTIPLHLAILENDYFIAGNYYTTFIEEQNIIDSLAVQTKVEDDTSENESVVVAAAVACYMRNRREQILSEEPDNWVLSGRQDYEMENF